MIEDLYITIRTHILVYWSRVRIFFNKRYPKKEIPKGMYCYQAKSDWKTFPDGSQGFDIQTCPYFHYAGKKRACLYEGVLSDDSVFVDQCKICGENYPDFD